MICALQWIFGMKRTYDWPCAKIYDWSYFKSDDTDLKSRNTKGTDR